MLKIHISQYNYTDKNIIIVKLSKRLGLHHSHHGKEKIMPLLVEGPAALGTVVPCPNVADQSLCASDPRDAVHRVYLIFRK